MPWQIHRCRQGLLVCSRVGRAPCCVFSGLEPSFSTRALPTNLDCFFQNRHPRPWCLPRACSSDVTPYRPNGTPTFWPGRSRGCIFSRNLQRSSFLLIDQSLHPKHHRFHQGSNKWAFWRRFHLTFSTWQSLSCWNEHLSWLHSWSHWRAPLHYACRMRSLLESRSQLSALEPEPE